MTEQIEAKNIIHLKREDVSYLTTFRSTFCGQLRDQIHSTDPLLYTAAQKVEVSESLDLREIINETFTTYLGMRRR